MKLKALFDTTLMQVKRTFGYHFPRREINLSVERIAQSSICFPIIRKSENVIFTFHLMIEY